MIHGTGAELTRMEHLFFVVYNGLPVYRRVVSKSYLSQSVLKPPDLFLATKPFL